MIKKVLSKALTNIVVLDLLVIGILSLLTRICRTIMQCNYEKNIDKIEEQIKVILNEEEEARKHRKEEIKARNIELLKKF